ncbi:hypothetical protein TIFTF001_011964 [Ficus carica]|uniref:Uncharacterized protein n=1 Tax=Ficus carica TaxID=3494 RepID=A0AA87ZZL3_FICCA|nr:hypothetical protein TIFTF001_011964 [Ficus carica]
MKVKMASKLASVVPTRVRSGWTMELSWKRTGRPNQFIVARPVSSLAATRDTRWRAWTDGL